MTKLRGQWERDGKGADARDLAEGAALARDHRRKLTKAEREAREMEAHARRVGASLRRTARARQARYLGWFTVAPKREGGRSRGKVRDQRLETMAGLTFAKASHRGTDGLSSFHFGWRSRGLRPRKGQKNSNAYKRGEAVRLVRYILRETARELPDGGVVSNIGVDPDEIASVFGAVEELEMAAGQSNANVYVSMVVSLPHELDAAGRERTLRQITSKFEEENLPFAAVLHRPDPGRDARNFHAHVILSLRPFRKEQEDRYSFAALSSADLNDGEWITPLREHIAVAMNEEMAQLEVATGTPQRCFTHLSNAQRGMRVMTKAEGKDGPGRKAADRRAANASLARAELPLHHHRLAVLDDLINVVADVAAHVPLDVPAQVEAARQMVLARTRSLASAARAAEARERIRRIVRSSWIASSPPKADRHSVPGMSRPDASCLSEAPLLNRARSLGSVPGLSRIPFKSQHGASAAPTLWIRKERADHPKLSSGKIATTQDADIVGAAVNQSVGVIRPVLNRPPSPINSSGLSSRRDVAGSSLEIEQVVAALRTLSFLPLVPLQVQEGRSQEYALTLSAGRRSDRVLLELAERHQRDARVQALFALKYRQMLDEVRADLTIRSVVRPKGNIERLFDRDPALAAAVAASLGRGPLADVIREAREYWDGPSSAARPKPASSTSDRRSGTDKVGPEPDWPTGFEHLHQPRGSGR